MQLKPISFLVLASLILVVGVVGYVYYNQTRVYTLRVGTATKGNISYDAMVAFSKIMSEEDPRIKIQVVETKGSAEIMDLLHQGKIEMGVAQNDQAPVVEARTVAFLYPQYFHLIVPIDSSIKTVADLRGKRVGTPAVGGGSYSAFMSLIKHYEIKPDEFASFQNLSTTDLTKAFLENKLDAMFGSDAIGEERPRTVLGTGKARLVQIDQAAAMRLTLPYVEALDIPKGAYKANPPVPEQNLETVGIYVSLLVHREVDAEIVREITRVLFDRKLDLGATAPQLLALRSPVDAPTLNIPIHQGAQAFYDREKPGFLQENADYVALLLTFATMGVSGLLAMRSRFSAKEKNRADEYTQEIIQLMEQARCATDVRQLDTTESRLFEIFKQVADDLDHDRITRESVEAFTLTWNQAIETVRHRQLVLGNLGSLSNPARS